jgi:hypothetical protein
LTAEESRQLQIPESIRGPLKTPIAAEEFSTFLKDRYDLMREDFIGSVRRGLSELSTD